MTTPYSIRPARPSEADRLTSIAHAAKRYWNYPEPWIKAWRDDLSGKQRVLPQMSFNLKATFT